MKTLDKKLPDDFFFEREKVNGEYLSNKCGRDFLYFALAYHEPERYGAESCTAVDIEQRRLFGFKVKPNLAWTQVQFFRVSNHLKHQGFRLTINDKKIKSFFGFVMATLFSRKVYSDAVTSIKKSIDMQTVCGIDISLGQFGLLDHVMFVYGYDEEGLLVVDSHKVQGLEYEEVDINCFIFKLPYSVIEKRWTRFGRVWIVEKI